MVVEKLKKHYLDTYLKELKDLEIGYTYNTKRICHLFGILGILYYIKNTKLSADEIEEIIDTVLI